MRWHPFRPTTDYFVADFWPGLPVGAFIGVAVAAFASGARFVACLPSFTAIGAFFATRPAATGAAAVGFGFEAAAALDGSTTGFGFVAATALDGSTTGFGFAVLVAAGAGRWAATLVGRSAMRFASAVTTGCFVTTDLGWVVLVAVAWTLRGG